MDDTARNAGGKLGEYAYRTDRSAADLVRDIISNVQEMVRSEVRLAKAEVREEVDRTISGAKKLGVGAVAGLFALNFILWGVVLILGNVMPMWAATLVMGVALGAVAGVLLMKAKSEVHVPKPQKTIDNVKENVEWMKNQTRS